jgi:hypothetical protein
MEPEGLDCKVEWKSAVTMNGGQYATLIGIDKRQELFAGSWATMVSLLSESMCVRPPPHSTNARL